MSYSNFLSHFSADALGLPENLPHILKSGQWLVFLLGCEIFTSIFDVLFGESGGGKLIGGERLNLVLSGGR